MCLCKASDTECFLLLTNGTFGDWYRASDRWGDTCPHCVQRAISIAIHYDSTTILDNMLQWTNCHQYIMELFLAAWVNKKWNIVIYLLHLWCDDLFPKNEFSRVFTLYQFQSDLEESYAKTVASMSCEAPYTMNLMIMESIADILRMSRSDFLHSVKVLPIFHV